MKKSFIPEGYHPVLDEYDTQRAIAYIKRTFQDEFASALDLKRVSAPLFVTDTSTASKNTFLFIFYPPFVHLDGKKVKKFQHNKSTAQNAVLWNL